MFTNISLDKYDILLESNPKIKEIKQVTSDTPEILKNLGITNIESYDTKHSLVFSGKTEEILIYFNGKPNRIVEYNFTFIIGCVINNEGTNFEPRLFKIGADNRTMFFFKPLFKGFRVPTQDYNLKLDGNYIFLENGVDDIRDTICDFRLYGPFLTEEEQLWFNEIEKVSIRNIEEIEIDSISKNVNFEYTNLCRSLVQKNILHANVLKSNAEKSLKNLLETFRNLLAEKKIADDKYTKFISKHGGSIQALNSPTKVECFDQFEDKILMHIFNYLEIKSLIRMETTSKTFCNVIRNGNFPHLFIDCRKHYLRKVVETHNFVSYYLSAKFVYDDDIIMMISQMKSKRLNILRLNLSYNPEITDRVLPYLSECEVLSLGYCKITDRGLSNLSKCKYLKLDNCNQITDVGLCFLTNCIKIEIYNCNKITKECKKNLIEKGIKIYD